MQKVFVRKMRPVPPYLTTRQNKPMIELLIQYLTFASQGPQEFCIACVPFGLMGIFTRPLSEQPKKYAVASGQKQAVRGAKRKAKGTKATPRTGQKPKKKEAKPWYVAPPMTLEQDRLWCDYQIKRNFVKSN